MNNDDIELSFAKDEDREDYKLGKILATSAIASGDDISASVSSVRSWLETRSTSSSRVASISSAQCLVQFHKVFVAQVIAQEDLQRTPANHPSAPVSSPRLDTLTLGNSPASLETRFCGSLALLDHFP